MVIKLCFWNVGILISYTSPFPLPLRFPTILRFDILFKKQKFKYNKSSKSETLNGVRFLVLFDYTKQHWFSQSPRQFWKSGKGKTMEINARNGYKKMLSTEDNKKWKQNIMTAPFTVPSKSPTPTPSKTPAKYYVVAHRRWFLLMVWCLLLYWMLSWYKHFSYAWYLFFCFLFRSRC